MINRSLATINVAISIAIFAYCAFGQTTEFTYQGSLKDGSAPANANYDFEFALFDALSGGNQIGSTLTRNAVPVTNGLFAVKLDFGSTFPGANRYLEIRVKLSGQPTLTPLSPRQLVNSSPYSVKSLNSDNATNSTNATQLGGVAANQYVLTGDTRLSDARPPTPGSANYIQNQNAGPQASSNFNVSGNGTASILGATTQFNLGGQRMLSASGPFSASLTALASNTFLGDSAGLNTTPAATINDPNGKFNTFTGALTGVANTTGANNSFFGGAAGNANITGSQNSFFGVDAGRFSTTGDNNTFSGAFAGFKNTTQHDNTFLGYFSGSSNGTNDTNNGANFNTFVGSQSGQANTTGGYNSFFGEQAGFLNTTGSTNAFFGEEAGYSNTTGATNSFFGGRAGHANTTGVENAFFGYAAGSLNTTGFFNAFVGEEAGTSNTTGFNNSFVGFQAGFGNSTGGNNTLIGNLAGSSIQTGSNNTIIGGNANVSTGNLTNATALGAQAFVTQNNSLVLGSINGVNGSTADTNVGIGTTAPTARLHVVGNGIITGNLTVNGTLNLPSFAGQFIQNSTSQQPSSNFNISGSGIVGGTLSVGNAGTSGRLFLNRATAIGSNSADVNFYSAGSPDFSMGTSQGSAAPSDFSIYDYGTANNALTIQRSTGNVGIGTISPGYRLHIDQTTPNAFATHIQTEGLSAGSSYGLVVSAGTNVNDTSFQSRNQAGTSLFVVRGDGNVGIGTTSPSSRFTLNSTTPNAFAATLQTFGVATGSSYGVVINAGTDVTDSALQVNSQAGTPFMRVRGNGYVGIGTTNPTSLLHLVTSSSSDFGLQVQAQSFGFSTATNGGVALSASTGFTSLSVAAGGTQVTGPLIASNGFTAGAAGYSANFNGVAIFNGNVTINNQPNGGVPLCYAYGSNFITQCASSRRFKKNIDDFGGGLEMVRSLRPVTFDWKSDDRHDIGLIAEEVEAVEPLLTTHLKDGQIQGVRYDLIGVVLVNAVKEQQAQIEQQSRENAELRATLESQQMEIKSQSAELAALRKAICQINPKSTVCKKGD